MKKFVTALVALSAIAAAVPAVAQDYGRGDGRSHERGDDRGYDRGYGRGDDRGYGDRWGSGYELRARYERIDQRIQRAQRNRTISYREADRLTQQLRELRRLDRQYRYSDGRLSRWEQRDLEQRADRLEWRLRQERRDGDYHRY